MNVILKNIEYNNILIKYNNYKNLYNIQYELDYIKINGIPINIKIQNYITNDNTLFLYINDFDTYMKLYNIELYIQKYIKNFKLLKNKNREIFITCKKSHIEDINNINITIYNIININNIYVPIIYII